MSMADLVKAVKVHATSNYNSDGWDYVVEAFEDEEIATEIRKAGARTDREAIESVHKVVKELDDRRKDIQAEAF